jgi:hypothetical protein
MVRNFTLRYITVLGMASKKKHHVLSVVLLITYQNRTSTELKPNLNRKSSVKVRLKFGLSPEMVNA